MTLHPVRWVEPTQMPEISGTAFASKRKFHSACSLLKVRYNTNGHQLSGKEFLKTNKNIRVDEGVIHQFPKHIAKFLSDFVHSSNRLRITISSDEGRNPGIWATSNTTPSFDNSSSSNSSAAYLERQSQPVKLGVKVFPPSFDVACIHGQPRLKDLFVIASFLSAPL